MLSNLNTEQREATLQVEGPVMVFAGAGTGKTRCLTHRVAYMIGEKHIKPYNILAITFTNKATNEMKERLISLVGPDSKMVTISTFHSLAARILRRDIHHLGYDRSFSILDVDEQLKEINHVLKNKGIDKRQNPSKKIQKMISYHKSFNTRPKDKVELGIFNGYNDLMKEKNLLDFDDLLIKLHELFKLFPEVLLKYQNYYHYVLVDEFQDTNFIQYDIVRLLTKENRNLFVVGDDDQSIYSFRGTNYENMKLFRKDFSEYKMFFLTKNYRSTQAILDGCNRLISENQNREKKELTSDVVGSPEDVVIYQAHNEKHEVDFILEQIFSIRKEGIEDNRIAILYRNSVLSRNVELGLIQMGFTYQIYGGISYLRRREIKDIIAYLRLIINNDDVHSFERIINVPSRSIGTVTVEKILDLKNKYKLSLFETLDACQSIVSKKRFLALIEFKEMIIKLKERMEELSLVEFYDELLNEIGYHEYLKTEIDFEERLENTEEFKSILLQIEEGNENISKRDLLLEAFDDAILSDDKLQSQKQDPNGIVLSTIHSVKGLEFDYVFLIGLEENVFPNVFRFADDESLEEERRIAYVAMTRARKKLYLLSAETRLLYGERFSNPISRFVLEFTGTSRKSRLNIVGNDEFEYNQSSEIIDAGSQGDKEEDRNFEVGNKVIHSKFGSGVIIAINDGIGQIFFDRSKGLKKILLEHHSLTKL